MLSSRQNDSFAAEVLVSDPLDAAIEWIKQNLSPSEVFEESQIADYARDNIDIDTVYHQRTIVGWVQDTLSPAEVFSERELSDWAADNL